MSSTGVARVRVRTAKAGTDDQGYSAVLLGIDEAGSFPLRVRASPAEQAVIEGMGLADGEPRDRCGRTRRSYSTPRLDSLADLFSSFDPEPMLFSP